MGQKTVTQIKEVVRNATERVEVVSNMPSEEIIDFNEETGVCNMIPSKDIKQRYRYIICREVKQAVEERKDDLNIILISQDEDELEIHYNARC